MCVVNKVEVCSSRSDSRTMSVMFAPFAGLCFMQYGGERCVMCAPVLPPLEGSVEKLRVWVQVTKDGSMFFLRQVADSHTPEETGLLPKEALPDWTSEFFISMYFWRDHLLKPLASTVVHCEKLLPPALRELEGSRREIDTTWHLQG